MSRQKPPWQGSRLALVVLSADCLISMATTLTGQSLTLGFDPVFYNPLLIAATSTLFTLLEVGLPFLVLRVVIFALIARLAPWTGVLPRLFLLFAAASLVSASIAIASFGRYLSPLDILTAVGLNIVNSLLVFRYQIQRPV